LQEEKIVSIKRRMKTACDKSLSVAKSLGCGLLLLLACRATAETEAVPAGRVYDFGEVVEGRQVKHVFTFTNPTSRTLNIKDVRVSCGCTTATVRKKSLAPGETTDFGVTFDSLGRAGEVEKGVDLLTDVAGVETIKYLVKGKVRALPTAGSFDFGEMVEGEKPRHGFKLKNDGGTPLRILAVNAPFFMAATKLGKKSLSPGEETGFALTFNSRGAPEGAVSATVYVATDSESLPAFKYDVKGNVKPLPPTGSHDFGVVRDGSKELVAEFKFANRSGAPVKIVDNVAPWGCRLEGLPKGAVEPEKEIVFKARLSPSVRRGQTRENVYLLTDVPGGGVFKYTLLAQIEPEAERVFDFGEIVAGAKPKHVFEFTNRSGKPLTVERVRVSCGCTMVDDLKDKRLQPGESARFAVTFDSSGREGAVEKPLYLMTDAEELKVVRYVVKGVVRPLAKPGAATASPPVVSVPLAVGETFDFGMVRQGEALARRFKFKNGTGETLRITRVRATSYQLVAEVDKTELRPGETATVSGRLATAGSRGEVQDYVYVFTDSKACPMGRFVFKGKVVP